MNTIFLDFDGVLFDTVLESYLLARYAYFDIEPFEKINEKEYELFHSVRYLITHSWHYYYIMKLIGDGVNIEDFSQEYGNTVSRRNEKTDSEFDKKFQVKRKDLIENHFDFWNKLDKPYPFFDKIKPLAEKLNIIIVSTKNEEAILRHCKDYGLNIEEKNVIGKNKLKQYGSKKEFLEYYIRENKIDKSIFIDDAISTIKNCSNIQNLNVYCANWGYVADKSDGLNEVEILKIIKEL